MVVVVLMCVVMLVCVSIVWSSMFVLCVMLLGNVFLVLLCDRLLMYGMNIIVVGKWCVSRIVLWLVLFMICLCV